MNGTDLDARIKLVFLIVPIIFGLLAARLWQLQVIMGDEYKHHSLENRVRTEKIPSPRGIIYDRNGKPLVKNSPYYFVALLPELARSADLVAIAEFLGMDPKEVIEIINAVKEPLAPIKIKGGLRFDEVAFIEARLSDYPGLIIEAEETRHYLYGSVGSHLIGYLGMLNPQQASQKDYSGVPRHAFIGQWGIEKMYDSVLRGEPGRRIIEVDALGRRLSLFKEIPPTKGQDIYLSIDLDLQQAAEEAFGSKVGAMVAIKPATGEVLALVSHPSFDPNLFSRGIDYAHWVKLRENKSYPLLNRALQSHYPPGSTFKIVTALAALETGSVKPTDSNLCTGVISKGRWKFRCWRRGGHGRLDMKNSLIESCDVYFYNTGQKTGIDNIALYARKLGLGASTGLGLITEKAGLVPDTEWKKRTRGKPWYPGETYNASIGQGFLLTTPIQLAQMMATVANGGKRYSLRLTRTDEPPTPYESLELDEENVRFIKRALRGVVTAPRGTGRAANSRYVQVAGKTGTAQVVSQKGVQETDIPVHLRDHAWFVAFAPVEEPEIALAVFVEHGGHGGAAAAPIARKAIEAYLAKDRLARPVRRPRPSAQPSPQEGSTSTETPSLEGVTLPTTPAPAITAPQTDAPPATRVRREKPPRAWTEMLMQPEDLNAPKPEAITSPSVETVEDAENEEMDNAPAADALTPAIMNSGDRP